MPGEEEKGSGEQWGAWPCEVWLSLWDPVLPHREGKAGWVIHWFPRPFNDDPLTTHLWVTSGQEPGLQGGPGTILTSRT